MPNGLFSGSITKSKDGSLYFDLQSLRVRASKRFTPSQLLPLHEWLNTAADDWDVVPIAVRGYRISYTHDNGHLRLESAGGVQYFDPLNDEALARLVSLLKRCAPMPQGEPQPDLPGLPTPTAEQLAKRSIYKKPMRAKGYDGHGGPPRATATHPPSYARSKERLALLMAKLAKSVEPTS